MRSRLLVIALTALVAAGCASGDDDRRAIPHVPITAGDGTSTTDITPAGSADAAGEPQTPTTVPDGGDTVDVPADPADQTGDGATETPGETADPDAPGDPAGDETPTTTFETAPVDLGDDASMTAPGVIDQQTPERGPVPEHCDEFWAAYSALGELATHSTPPDALGAVTSAVGAWSAVMDPADAAALTVGADAVVAVAGADESTAVELAQQPEVAAARSEFDQLLFSALDSCA